MALQRTKKKAQWSLLFFLLLLQRKTDIYFFRNAVTAK